MRIVPSLPEGVAGLPVGLPGQPFLALPAELEIDASGRPCLTPSRQLLRPRRSGPRGRRLARPCSTTSSSCWSCSSAALSIAAGLIWFERRLLGFFQDRYGPNRVGPAGLLQVLADTVKMLTKEDWIPPFADRRCSSSRRPSSSSRSLLAFVVVPVTGSFVVADLNIGLLFFLAMSSLGVYSVVLAGWSSTASTRSSAACAPPPRC